MFWAADAAIAGAFWLVPRQALRRATGWLDCLCGWVFAS
ncbi:hypothetical protein GME_11877 [Halomonas sp. TD01]|nr:hypothetical protein GME_11877 [Halomonas sp. TD01]